MTYRDDEVAAAARAGILRDELNRLRGDVAKLAQDVARARSKRRRRGRWRWVLAGVAALALASLAAHWRYRYRPAPRIAWVELPAPPAPPARPLSDDELCGRGDSEACGRRGMATFDPLDAYRYFRRGCLADRDPLSCRMVVQFLSTGTELPPDPDMVSCVTSGRWRY